MDGFSEENLSQILGNDPVATSVRIRIRQDEQAINNLTLGYRAAKQEIEGMVKALEKSGLLTGKLTDALAKVTGAAGGGMVGNTSVAGSKPIQRTPIDKGIGTNVSSRGAGGQAAGQGAGGAPQIPGTIQMTPLDKGVQTSTSIGQRLKQSVINYGAAGGPPTPPTTVRGAIADAAIPAVNTVFAASADRIDRNRAYSLQADRINMVFQQMKGMSQEQTQNVYRQPLTQYKLGAGGKNEALAMEAMTGLKSSVMAPAIEAMRIQSGFSMTAGQATGMIQNMASPEVVNRMFMMTGTSLIGPGGVQNDPTKVMQQVVQRAGLTNPDLVRSAALPGSVSRANLTQMGITGAMQDQYIQYAQMNLAYQDKGGKGMYDPGNKTHQRKMGISDNFAMQAEETERRRGEREENFYSRQNDNFADLEKTTQKLIATMGKLEDVMSGVIGAQIGASWLGNGALGKAGTALGAAGSAISATPLGALTSAFVPIGRGIRNFIGKIAGIGDFVTADAMERRVSNAGKKTTASATTISAENKAQYNKPTGGVRLYGPQVPGRGGLNGFNDPKRNTASSVQKKKAAPPPKKMLSRQLTDAEVDEGWAMIPPSWDLEIGKADVARYSDIKREAIMAYTPTRFRNKSMTLAELSRLPEFLNMHPTTQRAFQDAAMAAARETGQPLGLQSGWRSPTEQHNLYISRYKPVNYVTDDFYQGQYWDKKSPDLADVAVPGAAWSNHEHGLALDVIGDKKWLADNAHRFGLEGFGEVNNEDWHFQVAGIRAKGTGGGAGYNERTGFTSPGIELGQDGYRMDSAIGKNDIIQALYDAGIKTSRWTKNINGTDTPVGIDFMPVRFKDGNGYNLKKVGPSLRGGGSADAMERWLTGGKKGMRPVSSVDERKVMNQLASGTAQYPKGVPGSGEDFISFEEAARIMKDMGMSGEEIVQGLAVMGRESGGNRLALRSTSEEHSIGLFQFNMHPDKTSVAANLKAWGLSSIEDLTDPYNNIKVLVEHLRYNASRGKDPWHNWGPYKPDGRSHMYGTSSFFDKALNTAKSLGYIASYTGPMPVGDYVPKSNTDKPKPAVDSRPVSYSTRPIDMKALREHLPMPSPSGLANTPDRGMTASGAGATIMPTSNNITISPSITISTNGATVEQELEGLARKVAGMLEKEVNRVMLRRT